MELNICILHYNSNDTIRCLESLAEQTLPMHVILVNNASTDNSMDAIKHYLSSGKLDVELIEAPANGGFASGNNLALKWAHEHTPNAWNLLLNNDTLLPNDFIENLILAAEEIMRTSASPFAMSAMECDYTMHIPRHTGMQYLSIPTGLCFATSGVLRTPYLCGACLLVDPKAPLLDERYFLYYEDADYSKRLQEAGYQLLTTDQTYYCHKMGGSTSRNTNIISIQMESMWRYYRKYYPRWMRIVKWLRKIENMLRGRAQIARIIDQTYQEAYAE